MQGYKQDLAHIHDTRFGHFARNAAPGLLAALRKAGIEDGLVVDLGCGSGIWARELLEAGYAVLGIDQSAAMIALARKHAPGGEFRRASFRDARLPPCATVTAMGEVFNYIFDGDGRNGLRALGAFFRRVHAALPPGGLFLFDVAEPGRARGAGPLRKFIEEDDWSMVVENEEDPRRKLLTRRIVSFRRHGRGYRRVEEVHRLRLYRPAEIAAALRRAGFTARIVRRYGAFPLPAGIAGFQARRP